MLKIQYLIFVCNIYIIYNLINISFFLQRRAIESVPPLLLISKELNEASAYENYGEIIELLYWVLVRLRDPHIKSVQKENVSLRINICDKKNFKKICYNI